MSSQHLARGRILITGGAGYLGRGILHRAQSENWDAKFTIYSRDELKQDQCRRKYPDATYILGDIRNNDRLSLAMMNHQTVIHCGAIKYVDTSEFNVNECIATNVIGSQSVIKAARLAGVETCVAISTDKAVEPLNTYGLTKALMERLWLEASRQIPQITFNLTRYGNVIGSTGSVVPLFKRMAAEKGEVTVTDPAMTRFWLSIDEAVDLVVYACGLGSTGATIVPSIRAMKLSDLVKAVAPNAKVKVTGLRPGEKSHEKLLTDLESSKSRMPSDSHPYYVYYPDGPKGLMSGELTSNNPKSWIKPEEFTRLSEEAALI